jgi:hypothetical protein
LGKTLVKGEMSGRQEAGDDDLEDNNLEDDGEESDEDMEGNMVDYLFNEQSLRWIKKNYGTSMNFMYSYGLKFYDSDDCQVAQGIIKNIIQEG